MHHNWPASTLILLVGAGQSLFPSSFILLSLPAHQTMAVDTTTPLPLTPDLIRTAHQLIEQYIHRTPLLTCQTLNKIIGTPLPSEGNKAPRVRLYLKCENLQKIGAFKARGAHHALIRLVERLGIEQVRRKGVVTHSSGGCLLPSTDMIAG